MTTPLSTVPETQIRPVQYRDLEIIETLVNDDFDEATYRRARAFRDRVQQVRRWFGLFKILSFFPNPFQYRFSVYVAEAVDREGQEEKLLGAIEVSPFNSSRSTWRVEQVRVNPSEPLGDSNGIGARLLRYCLETVWEARTWVLEINIHQKDHLALYRQHGFQPLAELTYWSLPPQLLQEMAREEPDLPNLLPVSNADARLLYQLDCVSMPPLLRQVFDRHLQDFKIGLIEAIVDRAMGWYGSAEISRGYVFEPQRKAAIGYFEILLSNQDERSHQAKLTVHPAYTWLYPKLLIQMAKITRKYPNKSLELISADYQHERQEYLERLGAVRMEHTLLMSRSVWHKLRETKPEHSGLAEMLQGLQPVPRTPIPSRFSWLKWPNSPAKPVEAIESPPESNAKAPSPPTEPPENGHRA
ncbi:GNAT family N-acetyltransferase [Pannus brasiliensis CCIBt3594]|uniref:GNAT family N-acetyltransferase n=1 Tax=Pannus brasiliensis CCIBt3594 TaxID=1427578 RepID=A0AAW9QN93_9CHRO